MTDKSFIWNLQSISDNQRDISLKLNFTSPFDISSGLQLDRLTIRFSPDLASQIKSISLNQTLDELFYELTSGICKQVPDDSLHRSVDTTTKKTES